MVIALTLVLSWLGKSLGCHGSQDLQDNHFRDYHDHCVLFCDTPSIFQEGFCFALILFISIVLRLPWIDHYGPKGSDEHGLMSYVPFHGRQGNRPPTLIVGHLYPVGHTGYFGCIPSVCRLLQCIRHVPTDAWYCTTSPSHGPREVGACHRHGVLNQSLPIQTPFIAAQVPLILVYMVHPGAVGLINCRITPLVSRHSRFSPPSEFITPYWSPGSGSVCHYLGFGSACIISSSGLPRHEEDYVPKYLKYIRVLYPFPTRVRFQSSFSNRTPYFYIGFQTWFFPQNEVSCRISFNGILKFSFMQSRLKSLVEDHWRTPSHSFATNTNHKNCASCGQPPIWLYSTSLFKLLHLVMQVW